MFRKKCYFCQRKIPRKTVRNYRDDRSKKINVCYTCVEYAERRAYQRA